MGKLSTVVLLILLPFLGNAQGIGKYDKLVIKSEGNYKLGNYAKAIKYNEKLIKKAIKKPGPESYYAGVYYFNRAKYNLAVGMLSQFDADIQRSAEISEKLSASDPENYAKRLLDVSELYILYGNFLKASEYLQKGKTSLTESDKLTEDYKARMNVDQAKIYTGMGFYNRSLEFIDNNIDYFLGRAVDKESYVDTNGKLKTRRLEPEEVETRYSEYADILTLKANTLRKQGEINKSDNAFAFADNWIDDNLGKSHIRYIQNLVLWTELLEENGTQNIPEDNYRRALNLIKREHVESHYTAQSIYLHLLKNYLLEGKNSKYKNLLNEYDHVVKKYFDKRSLYFVDYTTVNFDIRVQRDRTEGLENQVFGLVTNNTSIPVAHPKRIQLLQFLYSLAISAKNYANAEGYLKSILDIKKALYGDSSPEYHLARIDLANYYIDFTDKYQEAEDIYSTSFYEIIEKEISKGHVKYVDILNHLTAFYESADRYQLASETLDKALDATRTKYDNRDINFGIEMEKIADLQISIGEYDKAKENLGTALDILERERKDEYDVVHYIKALETSARLKGILGDFDEAESDLVTSVKLRSRAKATVNFDEVAANQELASLYLALGRYRTTEDLLKGVIKERERLYGQVSRRLIDPLVDDGRLLLIKGDYTNAEKTAMRANQIAEKNFGNESTKIAAPQLLLGDIYIAIGDYEKAGTSISKALEIQKKQFGDMHVDVAKSYSKLALVEFYQNKSPKEVESLFNTAKKIIEQKLGDRNPQYAELLKNMAVLYIAIHRFDDAFNSLGLAETIWVNKAGRRNNINAASIYVLNGDIHYEQKNYPAAETQYERAKSLYEKFFSKSHPEYIKVLARLSKVYFMEGDLKKSKRSMDQTISTYNEFIKTYFPALSEREKAKFWNTIKYDFEFYNTLVIKLANDNPEMIQQMFNNALTTKALLLNTSLKIRDRILQSTDTTLINMYSEWIAQKEILTNALSMSNEELLQNEIDVPALSQEVEQLEKTLSEKSELFGSNLDDKNVTWQDVKKVLKPNEVALEMVRFRFFNQTLSDSVIYACLYLKNDGTMDTPGLFLMKDGRSMEGDYFKFYRNSIKFRMHDPYSYRVYWKPIADHIGANSTLYLSADGVYNQINLEAIPTTGDKYVIDDSNIILVSNTKDIYFNKVKFKVVQEQNKATMFGNPEYYAASTQKVVHKITQLPGTEKEVEELSDLLEKSGWNAKDYLGLQATEGQLKQINNPKVFHIATHGFFKTDNDNEEEPSDTQSEAEIFNNPLMRTGLILEGGGDLLSKTTYNYNIEDGILTAYEAMNLNLEKTDLVVLSACETGLGDVEAGEGVFGLQRAFIVAGARTLIMSMFKVNDEATQKLMVNFYSKWLATGKKRESFIEAKKELRNEYKDPIYWGAFIMIGLD